MPRRHNGMPRRRSGMPRGHGGDDGGGYDDGDADDGGDTGGGRGDGDDDDDAVMVVVMTITYDGAIDTAPALTLDRAPQSRRHCTGSHSGQGTIPRSMAASLVGLLMTAVRSHQAICR